MRHTIFIGQRWGSIVGIVLVNLATFTWATNMVLGRWLRDDIGPLYGALLGYFLLKLTVCV